MASSRPELVLMIGLPASGKSTAAKAWVAEDPDGRIRVNWDELRLARYGPDWIFNRKDEDAMKAAARETVIAALKAGYSVVVDNTNLSRHVRASWRQLATDLGADYAEEDISTNREECIRRDRLRPVGQRVGQAVIDQMALQHGYLTFDDSAKPIVIIDIDGTVANCEKRMHHLKPDPSRECTGCGKKFNIGPDACPCDQNTIPIRRIPKNWPAFFAEVDNDEPIWNMIWLLEAFKDAEIIFISGRPISSGQTKVGILTEDWLLRHGITFSYLFLKQFGQEGAPAVEFKKAIIDHLPKERIRYIFDDHSACIEMYRRECPDALVCQVGSSNFS